MSMLTEKRNELVAKLNSLETARQIEIETKVAAYRASVEAQMPKTDIDKVKAVIAALDEVIAYETVSEVKVDRPVETVVPNTNVEARPGMATVCSPSRD